MNYGTKLIQIFFLAAAFILAQNCLAEEQNQLQNPSTFVRQTVTGLQHEVQQKHLSAKDSPQKLYQVVKKTIMPKVAVDQMAALVLGPMWRQADQRQRQQFIEQFGLLLTRSYADALVTVSDYDVTVSAMRDDSWQQKNQVAVSGRVSPKGGGSTSSVIYYLAKINGHWRIYDFVIDGVSFVQNYRSQFNSFQNIDQLIARITKLNQSSSQHHG